MFSVEGSGFRVYCFDFREVGLGVAGFSGFRAFGFRVLVFGF